MFVRWFSLLRTAAAAIGALALIVTFTPLLPWTTARLTADWTDSDGDVPFAAFSTARLSVPSDTPYFPGLCFSRRLRC